MILSMRLRYEVIVPVNFEITIESMEDCTFLGLIFVDPSFRCWKFVWEHWELFEKAFANSSSIILGT